MVKKTKRLTPSGYALKDISLAGPTFGVLTAQQALQGPPILPLQRILLYSPEEWESFVNEWAFFSVSKSYQKVQRFSGSGDRGIDVAGFVDADKLHGIWDNY